jgi:hypothetical protein
MRKLKVDMPDLELAFDTANDEISYYLDLDTGKVVLVMAETHSQLEKIYAEVETEDDEPLNLADLARNRNLPDWQIDAVLEAHQVETGYGTRYLSVPKADSHEGYRDMEDFIETVRDEHLATRLEDAIGGRGPFRRFKDVLLSYSDERERWFKFRDARLRKRILDWLASQDIEPVGEAES